MRKTIGVFGFLLLFTLTGSQLAPAFPANSPKDNEAVPKNFDNGFFVVTQPGLAVDCATRQKRGDND